LFRSYFLLPKKPHIFDRRAILFSPGVKKTLETIRDKFSTHFGFQMVLANISWLFLDKILRMTVGLFVVAWVARYLGPMRFGLLNYSIALVGLFLALAKLGLDGIIVRDIVRTPEDSDDILGTSFALKLGGSILLLAAACLAASLLRPGDRVILTMTFLVALGYLLKTFETIEFFFRAKVKSKYAVLAGSGAFLFNTAFRIILILTGGGVVLFAAATTLEAMTWAFGLVLAYRYYGRKLTDWRVNFKTGRRLLAESWPAFLSIIFAHIYLQVDQVMLGQMISDSAVGLYGAVVRISTAWYFFAMAVTWSVQASVVRAKERGEQFYATRMQDLFTSMALTSYAIALPIAFLARPLMNIIFGPSYLQAAPVLSIHILASVFVFVGVSRGLYVTNESLYKFDMVSNMSAAIANVLLNLFFIPRYGIIGAAWATLISYFLTFVGTSFLHPATRGIFRMQVRSLLLLDVKRFLSRKQVNS
jgi:PST family polysaccharide transporter